MANSIQIAKAYVIRTIFTATIAVAIAFTLSCSGDDGGGSGGGGGSQSVSECNDVYVGNYGDKGNNIANYKTVKIGDQLWMAENLNYFVAGSRCYGEGADVAVLDNGLNYKTLSKAEVQTNCDKYGRLYDWSTAMALPSDCTLSSCSDQIDAKHRGICPSGWHIPSLAEWKKLLEYVFLDQNGCLDCNALHLKAIDGWNGKDSYGFAALPSQAGGDCNFSGIPIMGNWWSTSVQHTGGASVMQMFDLDLGKITISSKQDLLSVRCLHDDSGNNSSSSAVVYGTPVDYEGETYQTVVIGSQTWMARSLNYEVEDSKGDRDDTEYTKSRYYKWATAMALPDSCNIRSCASQIDIKHRGLCPEGWHIPNATDWNILMKFVNPNCSDDSSCEKTATKLKATNGWSSNGNGLDSYGFAAYPKNDQIIYSKAGTYLWSSNESSKGYAYVRGMSFNSGTTEWLAYDKLSFQTVRCVSD